MAGFIRYPCEIFYSNLSAQDRIVYGHILNQQNMSGGKPLVQSAKKMSEVLHVPVSTVKDSLKKLEKNGYISVNHGHKSSYSVRTGHGQSRPRDVR